MAELAEAARKTGRKAFMEEAEYLIFQADIDFFEQVYFSPSGELFHWVRGEVPFPADGIVLSRSGTDSSQGIAVYKKIPNVISGQTELYLLIRE